MIRCRVIELTPEQEEIQRVCRDFAAREIRPAAAAVDEADTSVPWELWHKAAAIGLTSFMLPEELGGGGLTDVFTGCLVQEELCHGCSGIGNLITSNGFFAEPVLALGTEEQQERWLRPLTGDRPPMTALATTEPDSGSDAAAHAHDRAARVDGGYVLNGQKAWISNGGVAQFYVVFATVAPGTGHRGVTAFLLDRDDEGLSFGEPMRKMGQRAIVNTELFLQDCFVADDRRLGDEGEGFRGLMATFDRSRVTLAAAATGLARAATEYATRLRARSASSSASRSPSTRRSRSGSPTWRCASTRRACSPGAPRGCSTAASARRPRRRWRSCTPPRPRCSAPGARCRRSAAGATRASTRSRSGCATPSSRRSRRAPRTSSGSSSRAGLAQALSVERSRT